MGLESIFYNEINRWRDKKISEKENKVTIKRALKKALTKFIFVWEDQMLGGAYKRENIYPELELFSGEFMNLAVEVDTSLDDEEITGELREISKALKFVSNHSIPFGGHFENPIPKELGEALARIQKVIKKLE